MERVPTLQPQAPKISSVDQERMLLDLEKPDPAYTKAIGQETQWVRARFEFTAQHADAAAELFHDGERNGFFKNLGRDFGRYDKDDGAEHLEEAWFDVPSFYHVQRLTQYFGGHIADLQIKEIR